MFDSKQKSCYIITQDIRVITLTYEYTKKEITSDSSGALH